MRLSLVRGFLRAKVRARPVLLSHLITQRCNLSCPYCLWKDNTAKEMTAQEIMRVHRDAKENGFVGCFLWGGEPLLKKGIDKILAFDHSLGWFVTMATNGSLLPFFAKPVADNVDQLLVSLDLPSIQHDLIRQGSAFEQAIEGIRRVRQLNSQMRIKICSVLSRANFRHLKEMAVFVRSLDCEWLVQHMDLPRKGSGNPLDLSVEERDAAIAGLIALKREGFPIANSLTYLHQFHSSAQGYSCRCQFLYLTVWPGGEVRSCVSGAVLGNVRHSIHSVINSTAFSDFLEQSGRCSRCRDAGTLESTYLYTLRCEPLINFMRAV